jgi:hypothetical protein
VVGHSFEDEKVLAVMKVLAEAIGYQKQKMSFKQLGSSVVKGGMKEISEDDEKSLKEQETDANYNTGAGPPD